MTKEKNTRELTVSN